jgi:hypothetical protein
MSSAEHALRRAKERLEVARSLFPFGHPRRLVLHALYRHALNRLKRERRDAA